MSNDNYQQQFDLGDAEAKALSMLQGTTTETEEVSTDDVTSGDSNIETVAGEAGETAPVAGESTDETVEAPDTEKETEEAPETPVIDEWDVNSDLSDVNEIARPYIRKYQEAYNELKTNAGEIPSYIAHEDTQEWLKDTAERNGMKVTNAAEVVPAALEDYKALNYNPERALEYIQEVLPHLMEIPGFKEKLSLPGFVPADQQLETEEDDEGNLYGPEFVALKNELAEVKAWKQNQETSWQQQQQEAAQKEQTAAAVAAIEKRFLEVKDHTDFQALSENDWEIVLNAGLSDNQDFLKYAQYQKALQDKVRQEYVEQKTQQPQVAGAGGGKSVNETPKQPSSIQEAEAMALEMFSRNKR